MGGHGRQRWHQCRVADGDRLDHQLDLYDFNRQERRDEDHVGPQRHPQGWATATIGKVIGSPEFLGTVVVSAAAVAAAIAAVLGAFSLGLVQGLAKESVRWGKLIAGALQDRLEQPRRRRASTFLLNRSSTR